MKPKREAKKGDRCEHAVFDHETYRRSRDCEVRHLEGKPPGLLVPRIFEGKTALLCTRHCTLHEAPNVRKQKPRKVDAEQMDLVGVARTIENSFKLDAAMGAKMAERFPNAPSSGVVRPLRDRGYSSGELVINSEDGEFFGPSFEMPEGI